MPTKNILKVKSIFLSVNGECCNAGQGSWTTFVRFSGCSAKCLYCDSRYSFVGGTEMTVPQVIKKIKEIGGPCKNITLTGGEPLEQNFKALYSLIQKLTNEDYQISIETNGLQNYTAQKIVDKYLDDFQVNNNLSFVVDYKLPSAGKCFKEVDYNSYTCYMSEDFLKFVIKTDIDFYTAMIRVEAFKNDILNTSPQIYFSPCGLERASWLFQKMKETPLCQELDIGFNLQIHKVIFPNDCREEEK